MGPVRSGLGDRPCKRTTPGSEFDADFLVDVESCVTPADDAMIIYTSGSTGDPKAPVHTQGTLVRHTYNLTFDYGVTSDTVMFTAMPFFWVGGSDHRRARGHLTTAPPSSRQPAFDAAEALELIERHRGDASRSAGRSRARRSPSTRDFANADLSSVQRTSMPGDGARPTAARRAPMALGMTELCGNHIGVRSVSAAATRTARRPVGRSIEGLEHIARRSRHRRTGPGRAPTARSGCAVTR